MADTSDEILAGGKVNVNGQQSNALAAFRAYFDILNRYRDRLSRWVTFAQILTNHDGAWWEQQYNADKGINLKAFRDTAQTLRASGANTQLQLDLIGQTENLNHHWDDPAGDAALENYKNNRQLMEQDQQDLAGHAQNVAGVADNLQKAMEAKRDAAVHAVDQLINNALRNSPGDFENRLRTACEAMEAGNEGGFWSSDKHLYQHHGTPGDNWNINDVRNDISNLIGGFILACEALDKTDAETKKHIEENYDTLLTALDAKDGPHGPKPVTGDELNDILDKSGNNKLPKDKADAYAEQLNKALDAMGITDPKERAAFIAQTVVESGGYSDRYSFVEGGPNAPDSYFIQNYSQANGNNGPEDAVKYKGRGALQITGKTGYTALTNYFKDHPVNGESPNFLEHPELAAKPEYAFLVSAYWWTHPELHARGEDLASLSQQGIEGFREISLNVRGGHIADPDLHEDEREQAYTATLSALGVS